MAFACESQSAPINAVDIDALGASPLLTDNTPILNKAIAQGPGLIFSGAGIYLFSPISLPNNTIFGGAGRSATTWKLKSGSNADLFSANVGLINLAASFGTSSSAGAHGWGFRDLTLDGNQAGQTGGTSYCIRAYAYNYQLQNVDITGGRTGGLLLDWNGGLVSGVESTWQSVRIFSNGGDGWTMGGPTTTSFSNVSCYTNAVHNLHLAPNARGLRFTGCAFYAPTSGLCCLVEAPQTYFANCLAYDSTTLNVACLASDISWFGGAIYSSMGASIVGVQFGQLAGNTPFPNSILQSGGLTTAQVADACFFATTIHDNTIGAINEVNVGANIYNARIHQTAGNGYVSNFGFASNDAAGWLVVTGLPFDGTMGAGGYMIPGANSSLFGLALIEQNGTPFFTVDTFNYKMYMADGKNFFGYSDANASVQTFELNSATGDATLSGNLAIGQSATALVLASLGTIATANIGVARVAPAGAVTGIILAAGTLPGQTVFVVNESTALSSLTFAAAGSNVSGGSGIAIAGGSKAWFVWDSSTSLWY